MDISVEDVESMSSEQKHKLLCSDPVTTARHFSQRFQKFIAFMKGSFQLRGSPHVHSLWWVKDAPLRVYVLCLAYITTKIPSQGEDDELRTLVMRLQGHKHTHKCQKNGRRGIIPSSLVLKPVNKCRWWK